MEHLGDADADRVPQYPVQRRRIGRSGNIVNTGAGNLVMRADSTGTGTGTIVMPPFTLRSARRLDRQHRDGDVLLQSDESSRRRTTSPPATAHRSIATPNQLTAYMLVNNATNLQNIGTNLAGTYALGKDIDADRHSEFAPIGSISSQFTGMFEGGLGEHTISNLTIAPTAPTPQHQHRPVRRDRRHRRRAQPQHRQRERHREPERDRRPASSSACSPASNGGTISNVTVSTARCRAARDQGVIAGGLVGQNGIFGPGASMGTITDAHAAVNVTVGNGERPARRQQRRRPGRRQSRAPITTSFASGNVTGGANSFIGGLVGRNEGSRDDHNSRSRPAPSTSPTRTGSGAGGLVGFNFGAITNSRRVGAVTGGEQQRHLQAGRIGGLVGLQRCCGQRSAIRSRPARSAPARIARPADWSASTTARSTHSRATGAVSSLDNVAGGLVGFDGIGGDDHRLLCDRQCQRRRLRRGGFVGDNAGTITGSLRRRQRHRDRGSPETTRADSSATTPARFQAASRPAT